MTRGAPAEVICPKLVDVTLLLGAPNCEVLNALKNSVGYQLYLKGRYFWNKRTKEGFLKATDGVGSGSVAFVTIRKVVVYPT